MRYINKKKAQIWFQATGLQLPEGGTNWPSNSIVLTENDIVNAEPDADATNTLDDANIRYKVRTRKPPTKTITAYKLMRIDSRHPDKLFPLFVDATKETPIKGKEFPGYLEGGRSYFGFGVAVTDVVKSIAPAIVWDEKARKVVVK